MNVNVVVGNILHHAGAQPRNSTEAPSFRSVSARTIRALCTDQPGTPKGDTHLPLLGRGLHSRLEDIYWGTSSDGNGSAKRCSEEVCGRRV